MVLLVSLKFRRGPEAAEDICRLRYLFSALRVFQLRFRSARFVLDLVTRVSREVGLGIWDVEKERDGGDGMEDAESESELLSRAAAMIDDGIRDDSTGAADR